MIILFVIVGLLAGLLFLMLSASFIYKSYKAAIPLPGGGRHNLPVISYVGRSSRISIVPLPRHYFRKDTRASLFSDQAARSRLFTHRDTQASLFADRASLAQSLDQLPGTRSRLITHQDTQGSLYTDRASVAQSSDPQSIYDRKSMHSTLSVLEMHPPPTIVTQEARIYTIEEAD